MATLYDFKFDAEQNLDGVTGASGISLVCQVCKAVDPNTEPILLQAGDASVIREAVRDHVHKNLGEIQAVRESVRRGLQGQQVRNVHNVMNGNVAPGGINIQAGVIHGQVKM